MLRIMMCLLVCCAVLGCNKPATDEELGRKEVLPDCGPEQIKAMPREDLDASEWVASQAQVEIPALPVNRILVPIIPPISFIYMVPYDSVREITRRDEEIRRLETEYQQILDTVVLLNRLQPELLPMPRECPLNDEGDDE